MTMRFVLGVAYGLMLAVVGIFITDWRFWFLSAGTAVTLIAWSYLDKRDEQKERPPRSIDPSF